MSERTHMPTETGTEIRLSCSNCMLNGTENVVLDWWGVHGRLRGPEIAKKEDEYELYCDKCSHASFMVSIKGIAGIP